MSAAGRGRGYTGRHHMRADPRPGDMEPEDLEAVRTLAELSPRSPDPTKMEPKRSEPKPEPVKEELRDDPRHLQIQPEEDQALKELLTIDEQYKPLLVLLEQFSAGEDGIQFNRKLRHFESTVASMCPDEPRLLQAFATFRAAALLSGSTARKLAAVGASFTRQQRQQLLRSALLNVCMQGSYAKLDLLEKANPTFLINAANLMGDYFAEARLCNGNKVHILASPLLQYMKALLICNDIRAHRSLATQLMQNGRELLSLLSQELDELSISIRIRLLSPPPVSIVWLLLSADLCLNKFLPLPNTLQQFYASHLDLSQEENNYSEVNYGSWKKSATDQDNEMNLADKMAQNVSQLNLSHEEDGMKPKLRPILGAGAGLLRQEQQVTANQDSFDTWTNKSLSKRYDLNSWRQNEDGVEESSEPVFNPTVLPPNFVPVPDYPPPNVNRFSYPQENFNYLQQGDGAFIQNQYPERPNYQQHGDGLFVPNDRPTEKPQIERQPPTERVQPVQNEVQNTNSRRPVENWRSGDKEPVKDDNRKPKTEKWTRQRSSDNINDEDDKTRPSRASSRDLRSNNRLNRRDSADNSETGKPVRRHVTEVPRGKYWDHDDRCDIDYNS